MSAKITHSRRAAFLRALAASGNLTLSAERARVSRSWVRLQRTGDLAFDAAVRDAIAMARVGLRERACPPPTPPAGGRGDSESPTPPAGGRGDSESPAPPASGRGGNRPPAGWGFADGVELVVTGSNGRRVQVRRAKCGGWTRRVEERFLIALSQTCNVKAAAAAAGMSHSSAYAHRKRWPAFAREWAEAVAIGYASVEAALIEGAIDFFERGPVALGGPGIVTNVGEAIQVLTMNRRAVTRFGKGPA